jgi:hypothetical protein
MAYVQEMLRPRLPYFVIIASRNILIYRPTIRLVYHAAVAEEHAHSTTHQSIALNLLQGEKGTISASQSKAAPALDFKVRG